jgi:hypothetical protein
MLADEADLALVCGAASELPGERRNSVEEYPNSSSECLRVAVRNGMRMFNAGDGWPTGVVVTRASNCKPWERGASEDAYLHQIEGSDGRTNNPVEKAQHFA